MRDAEVAGLGSPADGQSSWWRPRSRDRAVVSRLRLIEQGCGDAAQVAAGGLVGLRRAPSGAVRRSRWWSPGGSGSDCWGRPWAQGQPNLAPDQLTLAGLGSDDDY